MRYWQTKKFSLIEHKWYEKLKKQGFIDEEKRLGAERVLIQRSSNAYRQSPRVVKENKESYFDLVMQGLHKFECDNPIDQIIMNQRSLGISIQEISAYLKKKKQKHQNHSYSHRNVIRYVIRKYENRWGIIRWTPKQLDPNWKKKVRPTK